MLDIPKPILDAGGIAVVLFLVAIIVLAVLQIVKMFKSGALSKPRPAEVQTESSGPGGMYRKPSCAYLESSVLQRDRVGRIETTTKETNELVKAMKGSMERVAASSEKQEELLGKMLEAMLKPRAIR